MSGLRRFRGLSGSTYIHWTEVEGTPSGVINVSCLGAAEEAWTKVYELDFSTVAVMNVSSSSSFSMDGKTWNVLNGGNATWIGPSGSNGFTIQPNATSSDLFSSTKTAPYVYIPITNIMSLYNTDQYDVRLTTQITHNADANFEFVRWGFERTFAAASGNYERMNIARGFNAGNTLTLEATFAASSVGYGASFDNSIATANSYILTLIGWEKGFMYYGSGSVGTFPTENFNGIYTFGAESSFRAAGDGFATGNAAYALSSSNITIFLSACPTNTSNNFSGSYRNLRIEVRKK